MTSNNTNNNDMYNNDIYDNTTKCIPDSCKSCGTPDYDCFCYLCHTSNVFTKEVCLLVSIEIIIPIIIMVLLLLLTNYLL